MSYQIIYDGFVVKTSKGFMLMIETGSNNCRDARGRRERHTLSLNIFDDKKILFEDVCDAIKHIDYKPFKEKTLQLNRGKSVVNFVKRCFTKVIDIRKILVNKSLFRIRYDENYKLYKEVPQTEQEVIEYVESARFPQLLCDTVYFL